jgi:hypothetical protein
MRDCKFVQLQKINRQVRTSSLMPSIDNSARVNSTHPRKLHAIKKAALADRPEFA